MRTVEPDGAEAETDCRVQAACCCPWAKEEARARKQAATNRTLISGFLDQAAEFIFDALVDFAAGELGGHADGVLDGVGVGASVADDAGAAHPQPPGPAALG